MKSHLIIIDMQYGFMNEHTEHLKDKIVEAAKCFDFVTVTGFINTPSSPFVEFMGWNKFMGGKETEILPEIIELSDQIKQKSTYTCFPTDAFDVVHFCGVDTDGCVLKSVLDCFELGIRPVVIEDLCASTGGKEMHEAGLKVIRRCIGKENVKSFKELGCLRS